MNSMDTQTWLVVAGIVVVVLILAGLFVFQKNQSRRLQQRFGPEYRRAVDELGRTKAEAELKAREKRVQKLHIVPLAPAEVASFSEQWKGIQGRFVDNPKGAVVEADKLVRELMQRRGYPMGDFEQRTADISVDYPVVVENYRAAHEIAIRHNRGQASTEDLRKAMMHYRTLFEELLGEHHEEKLGEHHEEKRSA